MARIIEAKKRANKRGAPAEALPVRRPSATFNRTTSELMFFAPLTPKTKSRARTFYSDGAIRKAFSEARGNVERFVQLLKASSITPKKTAEFHASLREIFALSMKGSPPIQGPVTVEVIVAMQENGDPWPVQERFGDVDNHAKAILDAMNGVVISDDRFVVQMAAAKLFRPEPGIWGRVCLATDETAATVLSQIQTLAGSLALDYSDAAGAVPPAAEE